MAQSGYTPIQLYYSTTASAVPTNTNLQNGELAINITDGKLYYKDNTGTVKVIAGAGGAGVAGGSDTQVQYNSSGSLAGSSNMTFDGTNLTVGGSTTAARFIPSGSTVATNGLYLPTTNTLAFSTNSTERMRIDSTGQVGIGGTAAAGYNIQIKKTITGAVGSAGVEQQGVVQSDVTSLVQGFSNIAQTAASSFTLSSYRHYDTYQGTIGAGSVITNQYGFYAHSTLTGATNNYGFYGNLASGTGRWNLYMAGTADNYIGGSVAIGGTTTPSAAGQSLRVGLAMTGVSNEWIGIISDGQVRSGVTSSAYMYRSVLDTQATTFTLASSFHYHASQSSIGAGSSVTNQYGYFAASTITGATNNYGFYGNIASGTGRYNLYMNGTADNYLGGNLGIGANVAGTSLVIAKTITGATNGRFAWASATVASDVTANAFGYATNVSTDAASFTLPALIHFFSSQGTIGSGSTVTNQYGYYANSTLTGATNNYGFYGAIASGTGRYNLYMAGTADNYLAGKLGIGRIAASGYQVDVGSSGDTLLRLTAAGQSNGLEVGQLTADGGNKVFAANNNYLAFGTNNTERARIDSSGNVGIGTNSPAYKLDVSGQARISTGLTITAATSSLYSTDGTLSRYSTTNGTYLNGNSAGWLALQGDGTQATTILLYGATEASLPKAMTFITNSAERFRIASNGAWGLAGANYGTAGQVLTSNGSGSAPTWQNGGSGSSQWTTSGSDIYYTTGSVGIGTTTPAVSLSVSKSSGEAVRVAATGANQSIYSRFIGGSPSVADVYVGADSAAGGITGVGASGMLWNAGNAGIALGTNNALRMNINSAGQVSIGSTTASQADRLYVYNDTQSSIPTALIYKQSGGAGGSSIPEYGLDVYSGQMRNNTTAIYALRTRSDNASGLENTTQYALYAEVTPRNNGSHYGAYIKGGHGNVDGSGVQTVSVIEGAVYGGTGTSGTIYALRLDGTSNYAKFYGLQIKSAYTGSNTQYFQEFIRNGSQVGTITTTTTATAYNTSSDYRLKENVQPMTGSLAKVQQLKPCTYTWKKDGSTGEGFIAHELQEIIPQAVTGEKDAVKVEQYEVTPAVYRDITIPAVFDDNGNQVRPEQIEKEMVSPAVIGEREVPVYQGIDTSFLVATLTSAIQEQQALIVALTARIEALETA